MKSDHKRLIEGSLDRFKSGGMDQHVGADRMASGMGSAGKNRDTRSKGQKSSDKLKAGMGSSGREREEKRRKEGEDKLKAGMSSADRGGNHGPGMTTPRMAKAKAAADKLKSGMHTAGKKAMSQKVTHGLSSAGHKAISNKVSSGMATHGHNAPEKPSLWQRLKRAKQRGSVQRHIRRSANRSVDTVMAHTEYEGDPLDEAKGKRGPEGWRDWQRGEYTAEKPDAGEESKRWPSGKAEKPDPAKLMKDLSKSPDYVGSGGKNVPVAGKFKFKSQWYTHPHKNTTGKVKKRDVATSIRQVKIMDNEYRKWMASKKRTKQNIKDTWDEETSYENEGEQLNEWITSGGKALNRIVDAFMKKERATNSHINTRTDGEGLYYHGHKIAWHGPDGEIKGSLCGWGTPTTRMRLNVVSQHISGNRYDRRFHQSKNTQHFDGEEIDDDDDVVLRPGINLKDKLKRGWDESVDIDEGTPSAKTIEKAVKWVQKRNKKRMKQWRADNNASNAFEEVEQVDETSKEKIELAKHKTVLDLMDPSSDLPKLKRRSRLIGMLMKRKQVDELAIKPAYIKGLDDKAKQPEKKDWRVWTPKKARGLKRAAKSMWPPRAGSKYEYIDDEHNPQGEQIDEIGGDLYRQSHKKWMTGPNKNITLPTKKPSLDQVIAVLKKMKKGGKVQTPPALIAAENTDVMDTKKIDNWTALDMPQRPYREKRMTDINAKIAIKREEEAERRRRESRKLANRVKDALGVRRAPNVHTPENSWPYKVPQGWRPEPETPRRVNFSINRTRKWPKQRT